jgi:hypothetical protein
VTLYATLVPAPDRPTSHVRVGRTRLGGRLEKGDAVALRADDDAVFFRVDPVDDQLADGIGDEVHVAASVAERLLPPPEAGEVRVETVSPGVVPEADRVVIDPRSNDPADLANLLRHRGAFLHRGTERYDIESRAGETGVVEFTVTETEPDEPTVRVGRRTRIEFVGDGDGGAPVAPATADELRAELDGVDRRLDEIQTAVDELRATVDGLRSRLDDSDGDGEA